MSLKMLFSEYCFTLTASLHIIEAALVCGDREGSQDPAYMILLLHVFEWSRVLFGKSHEYVSLLV